MHISETGKIGELVLGPDPEKRKKDPAPGPEVMEDRVQKTRELIASDQDQEIRVEIGRTTIVRTKTEEIVTIGGGTEEMEGGTAEIGGMAEEEAGIGEGAEDRTGTEGMNTGNCVYMLTSGF